MIVDKSKFITLTHYDGNNVIFDNDAPCLIKGKGSIKLTENISCDNAYYVRIELQFIECVTTKQCRL